MRVKCLLHNIFVFCFSYIPLFMTPAMFGLSHAKAADASDTIKHLATVNHAADALKNQTTAVLQCLSTAASGKIINEKYLEAEGCVCPKAIAPGADAVQELIGCAVSAGKLTVGQSEELVTQLATFTGTGEIQRFEIKKVLAGNIDSGKAALMCPKEGDSAPLDYVKFQCLKTESNNSSTIKHGLDYCYIPDLTLVKVCGADPSPQDNAEKKRIEVTYLCDGKVEKTARVAANGALTIYCP